MELTEVLNTPSITRNSVCVSEIIQLQGISLSEFVCRDKANSAKIDSTISWYHDQLNRSSAETILRQSSKENGTFLIRKQTRSEGFALSMYHENSVFHYPIHSHCQAAVFSIGDDDEIIHGLEKLVEHYQSDSGGLVTKLTNFIEGIPPPASMRKYGNNTIFHRCIRECNVPFIKEILSLKLYDNINARNEEGFTCLHLACILGYYDIVQILLKHGADCNALDSAGFTALHRACLSNRTKIATLLIKYDHDSIQTRCITTGWVPLHCAAYQGNMASVEVLLQCGAPTRPRTIDNETPASLAERRGHYKIAELLRRRTAEVPKFSSNEQEWFFEDITRDIGERILTEASTGDGTFLIRPRSIHGSFVLTMLHDREIFHFVIECEQNQDQSCEREENLRTNFFIDDGPYFSCLHELVENYRVFSDGLPCALTHAVSCGERRRSGATQQPTSKSAPEKTRKTSVNRKLSFNQRKSLLKGSSGTHPLAEIRPEHVILGAEIGQGEFGSVHKGTWMKSPHEVVNVAIKTLHEDQYLSSSRAEFLHEASIMIDLNHPCIVHFIGVCEGPPMMIIEELIDQGSLLDYMLTSGHTIDMRTQVSKWAAQIASGMLYLESRRFVHRDLAARNILLVSGDRVKIGDFGLSRAIGANKDYYRSAGGGRWPVKWYAPESINYGTFSHASDVWSYGVTLWEMYTLGDQPYGELTGAQVLTLLERGERLPRPAHCPSPVYALMLKCWTYAPASRPSFSHLYNCFTHMNST